MKILDVDGFHNGMNEIEETLSSQKDQVQQMERAVQDVVNLDDAFKGEGGNAIRDFYRSQHLPMLEQYRLFLSDYQSVIRQMKEALGHLEPSPDGFMRQSFLDNEVEEGLHRARQITVELTGEANATIRSVSDIVSVPRIQDWSFLQQVTHAQEEKELSLRKLHEFDHTQTASLSSLEEQVHTMTQQIARLQTVFQKGKLGIIEKKAHQEDSSFLFKLSEFTSVMVKNKVSEFLGTVEGALFAIVDIVSDLVDTLIALFTDPIGFFKGIIHTVLHPIDTAKYIWKDLKQSFEEEVVNGDVRSRARYFSYAGTYIAASIFGAKGVDKVGKMGKAGKMSSKTDVPYNVMTTASIKSFIHNGVKSTFGKVEDTAHQLLSSRTGKRALGLNSFSGLLQELFRKTKHVLNPGKVKSVMEKTYQKVVAGPVSRVAQSETFSRMGKVLLNEDGHVVVSGKNLKHAPRVIEIEVNFKYNAKYDSEEFVRQLKDQEKGMNELTIDEYLKNRDRYIAEGRAIEGNVAQQTAREEAFSDKVGELMDNGKSFDEAESEAKEWLNTQAALHNPDQIAGGKPDQIGGMGHKGVNSSIGSQWRYRIDVIDEKIREMAKNMTPEQLENTYLNVKLTH
ncbi:T7SS effector LXG polymorphic toxin [Rossellomorea vietnamensis]|uniref:T7SS effector LXG polymorphic toxin n=1 Tax=Rossellomorea vietnamensis TaxID=218284 RepID=A0ACD4CCV3_9BACI|nr:T7SS effector LXG polymorphic toxin [Rossellomorea vietnamensis]UXH46446.1 T7SS effector LXG polymorphic toxin [Rossellomorea vietnamensis]